MEVDRGVLRTVLSDVVLHNGLNVFEVHLHLMECQHPGKNPFMWFISTEYSDKA